MKQDTLLIVEKQKPKKGEFSLFKAYSRLGKYNDRLIVEEDAPMVLESIAPFFNVGTTDEEIAASKVMQSMFLSSLREKEFTLQQLKRAIKHAFNTKTFGNKDFITAVLSYDETVKYYTWNQVLGLLDGQKINSTKEMIYVEFMNGFKAYVHENDFKSEIMEKVFK